MMGYSPLVVSTDSGSHILRIPAESPLAILNPLGANRAMVVGWVWPVYSLEFEGSSMDRTKMDLPDCRSTQSQHSCLARSSPRRCGRRSDGELTAYAILLPLASAESWVPWPRLVTGAAARIRSMVMDAMVMTSKTLIFGSDLFVETIWSLGAEAS
jgi:hypothetical protein